MGSKWRNDFLMELNLSQNISQQNNIRDGKLLLLLLANNERITVWRKIIKLNGSQGTANVNPNKLLKCAKQFIKNKEGG